MRDRRDRATYPPTLQRAFLGAFWNHFDLYIPIESTVVEQMVRRTRRQRQRKLSTMTEDCVLDVVGVREGLSCIRCQSITAVCLF